MLFWLGIIPALVWQLGLAILYLVAVPDDYSQLVYGLAKLALVLWPLLWWRQLKPEIPTLFPKRSRSLCYGVFSAVGIVLGLGLFWFFTQPWLLTWRPALAAAITAFGLTSNTYIIFALGLAVVHAGFEEWYWRSFVFRGLQLKMAWPVAAGISSLAFAAHHAVVINQFAPLWFSLLGAAVVGAAGYLWCYLYQRTGSFLGSWLSHLVADLVVMTIGYWIVFGQ